jgi:hypothetical protein
MRWPRLAWFVAPLLAGCANHPPADWPEPRPASRTTINSTSAPAPPGIVTPAQGTTGRIVAVNGTARYAVIGYAIGVRLPPVEQRLNVYRNGLKVAEIKITGPSRDTNTIGDIVAGDCQTGDEVRVD